MGYEKKRTRANRGNSIEERRIGRETHRERERHKERDILVD